MAPGRFPGPSFFPWADSAVFPCASPEALPVKLAQSEIRNLKSGFEISDFEFVIPDLNFQTFHLKFQIEAPKSPANPPPSCRTTKSPVTNHQSPASPLPVIQLIQIDLPAKRIAVNSKQARGARLIAVETLQHPFDEFLFKLVHGFIELDSPLHHQAHQRFQLVLHLSTLRT